MNTPFTRKLRFASPVLLLSAVLLAVHPGSAQIDGSNVFLQAPHHEVGVNQCGAIASSDLPGISGPLGPYHPRLDLNGISMAADVQEDGWSVGTPKACGDYALPGSPIEGWAITYDDGVSANLKINTDAACSSEDIPGSITSYMDLPDARRTVWEGEATWSTTKKVAVTQTVQIPLDLQIVLFEVVICNTGSDPLSKFYYGRNIDPDNEQLFTGDFTTENTVLRQRPVDDRSLVEARGLTGSCYFALVSLDARSRVCYGNFGTANPYNMWTGIAGYSSSGTKTADEAISLAFKIDVLFPGQCDTLLFAYIMDEADGPEAIDILESGAPLGTLCDASLLPTGMSHLSLPSKVVLQWTPPPGVIGCQVQAKQVPAGPKPKTNIFTAPYNTFEIPYVAMPAGTNWVWRVKCLCTLSPLVTTPFTPYGDLFSVPILREGEPAEQVRAPLELHPNPASDQAMVQWESMQQYSPTILRVTDLSGRIHRVIEIPAGSGIQTHVLDVSNLPEGLYIVQTAAEAVLMDVVR